MVSKANIALLSLNGSNGDVIRLDNCMNFKGLDRKVDDVRKFGL